MITLQWVISIVLPCAEYELAGPGFITWADLFFDGDKYYIVTYDGSD
jgi:hypothetical protein